MDAIFVPITCSVCKRHSAVSVSKLEIKRKLETGEAIELRCAYDEVKWDATSKERLQIMKLSMENDTVDRVMSWPRRIDRQGAATTYRSRRLVRRLRRHAHPHQDQSKHRAKALRFANRTALTSHAGSSFL